MQHFILATLAVLWLFCTSEQTSAEPLKMFIGPVNTHIFYVEEGGSKDVECWVLGDEDLTINLTWSGPSVNESKIQKLSIIPLRERQRVGNWLNITKFSNAAAGKYTCRAKTSRDDLTRDITIAKSCMLGKFHPPLCTKSCSEHCKPGLDEAKERKCDHMNGTCLHGCLEDYTGSMCTESDGLSDGAKAGIAVGVILLVLVVLAILDWRTKLIRNCIQATVSKIPGFQAVPTSDPDQPPGAAPGAIPSSGPDGSSSQNPSEEETPLMGDTSNVETSVARDVVVTGQGARPKQARNPQPPQKSPTSTQFSSGGRSARLDEPAEPQQPQGPHEPPQKQHTPPPTPDTTDGKNVPHSVSNEQLEVTKVSGATASPSHTEEEVQELKRELRESTKKKDMKEDKITAEKDERIKDLKEQLERERESSADRVKDLKEQLSDKNETINKLNQQLSKMNDTLNQKHEEIDKLKLLRMEARDERATETLKFAEEQARKRLADKEAEIDLLKKKLEYEIDAVQQRDQNRKNPEASRSRLPSNVVSTPSPVASSSNEVSDNGLDRGSRTASGQSTAEEDDPIPPEDTKIDIDVNDSGNTDGLSELNKNLVVKQDYE